MKEVNHNKNDLLSYILLSFSLILVYVPALLLPFAQHDDYFYFAYDTRAYLDSIPQYPYIMVTGRGFYSILAFFMSKTIWTVTDFTFIRILNITCYLIIAAFLYHFYRRFKLSPILAALITLGIFTLPGFQLGILWVSTMPFTIGLFFALLSGFLLNAVLTMEKKFSLNKKIIALVISFTTFLLSLFTYQPWAMFFLLPTTSYLLFSHENKACLLKRFTTTLLFFFLGTTFYFLFQKYVILKIPSLVPVFEDMAAHHSGYTFAIGSELSQRIIDVTRAFLWQGSNLWFITKSHYFATILMSFIGLSTISTMLNIERKKNVSPLVMTSFLKVILTSVFIFLSTIPFLASTYSPSFLAYRVTLPFSALIVLLFAFSCKGFHKTFTIRFANIKMSLMSEIILGMFTLLAAILAFINLRNSTINNYQEFQYIKNEIGHYFHANVMLPPVIKVLTVPNSINRSYAGKKIINDEFNYNSLNSSNDAPYILRAALLSFGLKRTDIKIANIVKEDPNIVNISLEGKIVDSSIKTPLIIDTAKFFLKIK